MENEMRPLRRSMSFIIETVDSCNLDCTYCYFPKNNLLQVIPESIIVRLIEGTIELGVENVQFVWHGGEPLLAGIDFYARALMLQRQYGQPWQDYENVVQTNGTLIDESWLSFFREHQFGVGISIDGTSEIHDANRRRRGGGATYNTVTERFHLLKRHGCDGGVCAVVSRDSMGLARETLDHFVELGVPELALLPCFATDSNARSYHKAISPEEYADFMITAFDRWMELDEPNFQIRFFRNVIALLLGGASNYCKFTPDKCSNYIAVDFNGDVYPCDNFCGAEGWKLGSLSEEGLSSILQGEKRHAFLRAMSKIDYECQQCEWLRICWGGCTYHRFLADERLGQRTIFCGARKRIFKHIAKTLETKAPLSSGCSFNSNTSSSKKLMLPLYLELGTACNSKCYFCAASSTRKIESLSKQQWQTLQAGRDAGAESLILSGGEPTLFPELVELVKIARELGYDNIQVQTNGRRLRDFDYLHNLVRAGATDFGLSLHGHTSEIHDKITQTPASFKQTMKGIDNIRVLFGPNPPVAVNCVITPLNLPYLGNIAQFLIASGVSTIKFSYIHATGRAEHLLKLHDWPSKKEVLPSLVEAIKTAERFGHPSTTLGVEAIPYCILQGFESYCTDHLIQPLLLSNEDGTVTPFHIGSERAKHAKCGDCFYDKICLGPWKQYPAVYGWAEFKPVVGDCSTNLIAARKSFC